METTLKQRNLTSRYQNLTIEKTAGVTYTPKVLADFVAQQIVTAYGKFSSNRAIRILDPAVGHGELIMSLLENCPKNHGQRIEVCGFETDPEAIRIAKERIIEKFPEAVLSFDCHSFLEFIIQKHRYGDLSTSNKFCPYDLIIANPPYVRTQILGAVQTKSLSKQFELSGKIDLYHAFITAIASVLKPKGVAGIIASNRFMTTKSGATLRKALIKKLNINHIWDLGDTKIFDAAVLPAVIIAKGKNVSNFGSPLFTSIYQVKLPSKKSTTDPISALNHEGIVKTNDGRCFLVNHGTLGTGGSDKGIWRVVTKKTDKWLSKVEDNCWGTFRDIGKIRVGVKSCADKVFIRNDWKDLQIDGQPELLKPLVTHHQAQRYKGQVLEKPAYILYPHECVNGRRQTIDINQYPISKAYLESHRITLARRKYVMEARREWYEIWVPQDPSSWNAPKLVFRDISEKPTFWINLDGSVVNGDCYWVTCQKNVQEDMLWLAVAIGNSTFIECFYDYSFNNKLFAGRRRFMTQYVEQFPLPNPNCFLGKKIINTAKKIFEVMPSSKAYELHNKIDKMVWQSFGFTIEEIGR